MKKFFTLMLCLITLSITMVSCGDDEPGDGGSLKGKWYVFNLPDKYSEDYFGQAYHFVNKNTVDYYATIAGSPRWTDYFSSEELPSPLKGYYIQEGCVQTYTYYVEDNKVYIPMQGVNLTISGDELIKDGGARFTRKK